MRTGTYDEDHRRKFCAARFTSMVRFVSDFCLLPRIEVDIASACGRREDSTWAWTPVLAHSQPKANTGPSPCAAVEPSCPARKFEDITLQICGTCATWLRNLLGDDFFSHVGIVELTGREITDAGLEHLKNLTQLKELRIGYTEVTDVGLEHLKGLTQLQQLDLGGTKITDAGLEHVKELTQLQWLYLDDTGVTDAGLQCRIGSTQLEWLGLGHTGLRTREWRNSGRRCRSAKSSVDGAKFAGVGTD